MTDHLKAAQDAIRAVDDVADKADEIRIYGGAPGAIQDRHLRVAEAAALIDIAETLRLIGHMLTPTDEEAAKGHERVTEELRRRGMLR